jgi:hypothetical protein
MLHGVIKQILINHLWMVKILYVPKYYFWLWLQKQRLISLLCMHVVITANFRPVLILLSCRVTSRCTVLLIKDGLADTLRCTLQLQHGHRANMNFLYCTRRRHQSFLPNVQSSFRIFRLSCFRECGFEIWNAESSLGKLASGALN